MFFTKNPFMGLLLCSFLAIFQTISAEVGKLICFYNTPRLGSQTQGPAPQITLTELEPALNFCNFLIYGYAGIDPENYKIKSFDLPGGNHISDLRKKFRHVRFLLSVGGDRDINGEGVPDTGKYLSLLEQPEHRNNFRASVMAELNRLDLDGIDLAWQFPKNKPKLQQGLLKRAWGKFRGWFGSTSVDEKAAEHKEQFTTLMGELRSDVHLAGKLLSLTMLPHVSAELFIDIPTVLIYADFVNLATYDFQTPERDPKVADLPAPLQAMYEREPSHNVQYQVEHWLNETADRNIDKLHIGITSYGRSWVMSRNSGITGYPPIPETEGPAPGSNGLGILSWPEICELLQQQPVDRETPHLRKVGDPTKKYGVYAYRSADDKGENGLWVGYEDPSTAANKAAFARAHGLGGVAFHDLTMDDVRGQCAGEKFPILRSIKFKL